MKCSNLLVTFLLGYQVATLHAAIAPRIIGGTEAVSRQFTYAAAIRVQTATSRYFCGGGFLSWDWVITSANCIYQATNVTVQLGSNLLEGDDPDRMITGASEFIVHPDFDPVAILNDIGLVHLDPEVDFTFAVRPPLNLNADDLLLDGHPTNPLMDGGVLTLGWGSISDDNDTLSNTLRYVNGTILPLAECRTIYGNALGDNMACFQSTGGTCIGDNGGPLVVNLYNIDWLAGIASFIGTNGCESGNPSGFTQVYPYTDWIRSTTGLYYIIL